jgi:hypothetical protein
MQKAVDLASLGQRGQVFKMNST